MNNNFFSKIWNTKSDKNKQSRHSKKSDPSFKPSLFTNLSKLSSTSTSSSPSSFYTGKVQYGGAMSANRSTTTSPYVVPKVKKRAGEVSGKAHNEKIVSGSLSSTARKILQTLEKMSTPLQDIKKIPPPNLRVSNLFGRQQQRNKRPLGASFFESSKRVCPPKSGRTALSRTVNKSANIPLDNSLVTRSLVEKFSGEFKTDTATSSYHTLHKGIPGVLASLSSSAGLQLKSSGNVGKIRNQRKAHGHYSAASKDEEIEQPDLPEISFNISTLPAFNFNKPESTSTPAPPKLSTSKEDESDASEPKFLFAAPISASKRRKANTSATKLNFNSPLKSSHQNKQGKVVVKSSSQLNNASPLTQSKKNTLNTEGSVMDILGNKTIDESNEATKDVAKLPLGELFKKPKDKWECDVCMVMNEAENTNCVACEASKPGSKPLAMTVNPKKWDCGKCSAKNDNEEKKCKKCTAPKPGSKSCLNKSDAKSSKWTCDVCLITNDNKREKCEACEAPKPGCKEKNQAKSTKGFSSNISTFTKQSSNASFTFGGSNKTSNSKVDFLSAASSLEKFSKPKSSWTCSVCLIPNAKELDKCAACENPNPDRKSNSNKVSENKSTSQIKFGFKQSASSKWTCDVCLVPNEADRTQCIACESPHGGAKSKELSKTGKSTFQFGSTSSNVYQFGIKQAAKEPSKSVTSDVTSSTTATTGGSTNTSSAAAMTSTSQFKFGATSPSKSTSGISAGESKITFGGTKTIVSKDGNSLEPSVPNKKLETSILFGSKVPAKKVNQFVTDTNQATVKPSNSPKSKVAQGSGFQLTDLRQTSKTSSPPMFGTGSKNLKGNLFQQQPFTSLNPEINDSKHSSPKEKQSKSGFPTPSSSASNAFGGSTSSAIQSAPTQTSLFTGFGKQSNQTTSISSQSQAPPAFKFGSQTTPAIPKPVIPFGSNSAIVSTSSLVPTAQSINTTSLFGSKTSEIPSQIQTKKVNLPGGTPVFSGFGQPTPPSQNKIDPKPPTFTGFQQQSDASQKLQSEPAKPIFGGFGQPPVATSQPSANFSFGSTATSTSSFTKNVPALPKSGFSFGSTTASKPQSQFGNGVFGSGNATSSVTTQANAGFSFGSAPSKPQASVFGTSQPGSKPAFGFDSKPNTESKSNNDFQFNATQTNSAASTGFNFGSTAAAKNPNPNPSAGFAFGSSAAKPAFSATSNTPFQFGSSTQMQAKPDSTTHGGFQFHSNQPPAPSFGQLNQPQPPAFGQAQSANPGSSMFNIGQSGRATPRTVKQAKRRLKK